MGRTITTTGTVGIRLTSPLDNPVTVAGTASVVTTATYAIYGTRGVAWSVANYGVLEGAVFGVTLASGGLVTNGNALDTTASISAGQQAIYIVGGPGTIVNYGSISATNQVSTGAQVAQGAIVNGSNSDTAASISGIEQGVVTGYGPAGGISTVTNYGTIADAIFHAVWLDAGGSVVNGSTSDTGALIAATSNGEGITVSRGLGSVTNFGSIVGGSVGVDLGSGGSVVNGSAADTSAFISASGRGVVVEGGRGTVTNYGTISGGQGVAVAFQGRDDRLIVHPGAVFVGKVMGDARGSVLELASASTVGSISGIGIRFTNFNEFVADAGAHWVLHHENRLGNGATIAVHAGADLAVEGTLEIGGTLTLGGLGEVRGVGTIAIDAAAVLNAGVRLDTQHIQFLGGGGETLDLHRPAAMSGTIDGFGQSASNAIDLVGVAATSLDYTTLSSSTGVLAVTGASGSIATIRFTGGNYSTGRFHYAVVSGSTDITFG